MNYINTSSEYIVMFSIIGLTFALIRRRNSRKSIDDKSLISILSNDYNLSSYASLSILSLLYAIFQGVFLGAGLGFISFAFGRGIFENFSSVKYMFNDVSVLFSVNILYFLICLFLVVLTRIFIESISLIFRVSEDISKAVNR